MDGTALYQPSKDLVVSPPIAQLKPGESQLFRVALRGPRHQPGELAYRLVLEDGHQPQSGAAGVSFRLRYDLPVLVGPTEPARQALRWQPCQAKPDYICLRLHNDGNRRVTFQSLLFEGLGWTLPVEAPGTVLAGSQREWQLPLRAGQTGVALRVAGVTRAGEPFRSELLPQ